jgi:2-haloacid dehalogenase
MAGGSGGNGSKNDIYSHATGEFAFAMIAASRIPTACRTLSPVPIVAPIKAVVFDVGGVLIDWNPRYLYRTLIPEEADMERFLAEVCTPEWHSQHDIGASYEATIPALVAANPEWEVEVRAWSERFVEMYGGVFDGTVALLRDLHRSGVPLFASTNWGAQSWAAITARYEFFGCFDGALVSGEVGIAKPDPAFFDLLVETYSLEPSMTLYIEDNVTNLKAAAHRGFVTHLFVSSDALAADLRLLGLIDSGVESVVATDPMPSATSALPSESEG